MNKILKTIESNIQTLDILLKNSWLTEANELYIKIDPATQLIAIVAIDKSNRGPAIGGTRCISYESVQDAITDAIKLSITMGYKTKFAGLPFSGGKVVMIQPKQDIDREERFAAYGKFIEGLNGRIITGCDSGVSQQDMRIAAKYTKYITGLPEACENHDDLAFLTALGIQEAMRAAIDFKFSKKELKGIKISIQGLGKVGYDLATSLYQQGAELIVTDIDPYKISLFCDKYDVKAVAPNEIYQTEYDIFAPCGLGGVINNQTVEALTGKIICGAANNPLSLIDIDKTLKERGIIYIPDFVANIGGTVYAALAHQGSSSLTARDWLLSNLFNKTLALLNYSKSNDMPTYAAAMSMLK